MRDPKGDGLTPALKTCGKPRLSDGQPCGWRLNGRQCLWHGPTVTPEDRRLLALKGGVASRLRMALPPSSQAPTFATREDIVAWAQEMAGKVLRGELDPKLSAEARGHAQLALQARTAEAQERLVEALLRVEHGGAAMLLLTRLQDGLSDGRRRPLPGRPLPLVSPGSDAS